MLVASALIRTTQSLRSESVRHGACQGSNKTPSEGYIAGGLKLAALSVPVAAARLGASLYLRLSIDGPYVIPRIDQRNRLEAS